MKGQGFYSRFNFKVVLVFKQISYEYIRSFKDNLNSFLSV